jgi:hypothetical protein
MTRYINLCRETPKKQADELTKYERYKESYELYRNLEARKEYHEKYNKMYREKHSGYIDCECGTTYKILSGYSHVKSQKHIAFSQKQNSGDT